MRSSSWWSWSCEFLQKDVHSFGLLQMCSGTIWTLMAAVDLWAHFFPHIFCFWWKHLERTQESPIYIRCILPANSWGQKNGQKNEAFISSSRLYPHQRNRVQLNLPVLGVLLLKTQMGYWPSSVKVVFSIHTAEIPRAFKPEHNPHSIRWIHWLDILPYYLGQPPQT